MIIFENTGEIDPKLITLIGVNVKTSESAIGYFGTGLKYSIACMLRWGEELTIQSGEAEFSFAVEETDIRGKRFQLPKMVGKMDELRLSFTTELGKNWDPWMVYRELWCNAWDEPGAKVWDAPTKPRSIPGLTRVIARGPKIEAAHETRRSFILTDSIPLHVVEGLEVHQGPSDMIFYRGIAVQKLAKPSTYKYNITERLYLTEDRTAGSWQTDPIIARGLTKIADCKVVDATLTAPASAYESRLDYDYVSQPGAVWRSRAEHFVRTRPTEVPGSVRDKFMPRVVKVCPTCQRPM